MTFRKTSNKAKQPDSLEHGYNYVLFLLNLRLRTEGQIREKMHGRGYLPVVIDETVKTLKRERLVDDSSYAAVFLESIKNYKFYGYYMAKKKMMERRLPQNLIERNLNDLFTVDDETKIAERFLKKEMGGTKKSELEPKEKQKLVRKLQTRGFRIDVVSKLLF